jgi:hypothetical protein
MVKLFILLRIMLVKRIDKLLLLVEPVLAMVVSMAAVVVPKVAKTSIVSRRTEYNVVSALKNTMKR